MTSWEIGAGGWAYFRGASGQPLRDYARAFSFVEVNTTFYRHPSPLAARRWRRSVPAGFRFAVKVHRDVSHGQALAPTRRTLSAFTRDVAVARALGAEVLVVETPATVEYGPDQVRGIRELANLLGRGQRLGVEARAYEGRSLPPRVATALGEVGGTDVVDLSKGHEPRVESDLLYTRLLGRGRDNVWEFSDAELRALREAASRQETSRRVFTFHGVRMYRDAARFLQLAREEEIPAATRGRGIDAVREVLEPDATFPATRAELLEDHGWKVVARTGGENVHVADLLRGLPARRFAALEEVLRLVDADPGGSGSGHGPGPGAPQRGRERNRPRGSSL